MAILSSVYFLVSMQIFASTVVGATIGYGREKNKKPAGIKTHALVCLGSCLVMIISKISTGDPMRLAAQVVSGIGFLCAGVIIVTKSSQIIGLTTAAGLWFSACVGLAIGSDIYWIAIPAVLCYYLVTEVISKVERKMGLEDHPKIIEDETIES